MKLPILITNWYSTCFNRMTVMYRRLQTPRPSNSSPLAARALRLAIGAGRSCAAPDYRVAFGELMKINEHDCVVLTADLPGESLETGDLGTVVHIHKGGAAYEVEFTTLDGRTLAVATVESQNLRP